MASDRRPGPARLVGRPLVPGAAEGRALVIRSGLSFAMGVDVASGRVVDVHSPARGELLGGRILVMPSGRGSSSASTSFAECIRLGTAPAAILLGEIDEILVVGAIVARTLYGRLCPIVQLSRSALAAVEDGAPVTIDDSVVTLASWRASGRAGVDG